jgi:hypothetical protein
MFGSRRRGHLFIDEETEAPQMGRKELWNQTWMKLGDSQTKSNSQ